GPIPRGCRALERLGVELTRAGMIRGSLERLGDQRQQLETFVGLLSEQLACSPEQVGGGRVLPGTRSAPSRGSEPGGRPRREIAVPLVVGAELDAIAVCLLEVESEDRLEL